MDCSLWFVSCFPKVNKCHRVLFMSESRVELETDWQIGVLSAVMQALYQTIVVKRKLSWRAKLLIYQLIYFPTLTDGHKLWIVTERVRWQMQATEMSFL